MLFGRRAGDGVVDGPARDAQPGKPLAEVGRLGLAEGVGGRSSEPGRERVRTEYVSLRRRFRPYQRSSWTTASSGLRPPRLPGAVSFSGSAG